MHPALMTMFADERAQDLRSTAAQRRRRVIRGGARRHFFTFRRPRRGSRVAHA
jgi:hypothetical protein